jgi:hypothetical protein
MKLDPNLSVVTKIRIKDLDISPKTIKLPEGNTGKMLQDIGMDKDFFVLFCFLFL